MVFYHFLISNFLIYQRKTGPEFFLYSTPPALNGIFMGRGMGMLSLHFYLKAYMKKRVLKGTSAVIKGKHIV